MARLGSKRVSDAINYERDIKGKRLIRLNAGVGSGKNYWVVKLSQEHPELRILFITSRVNVANSQALKMGAEKFLDIETLIDDDIWGEPAPNSKKKIVCTNARIANFIKSSYDPENRKTHLWTKFDLIIVDEAHSLSMDATFSDNVFYVEKLLKYTYNNNKNCDIVMMSGTQDPIDWLFNGQINERIYNLDLYNECIHLEPDVVHIVSETDAREHLVELWKNDKRSIYFANHRSEIGKIIKFLLKKGIPIEDCGFSFNLDNKDKVLSYFPEEVQSIVEDSITYMNQCLVEKEQIPQKVKIFFSTSKNKEGISIINDDIKTIFIESLSRTDVIQMAGRVRGNSEAGAGVYDLVVVHDAKQHSSKYSDFNHKLSENCLADINKTVEDRIMENYQTK